MKIAIDISPLKSGHQFRGIGFYTKNLVESLQLIKVNDFEVELIDKGKIPPDCDLVHYPYFDLFWVILPMIKNKKTVVTIHDVTPLVFPKNYPPGIKGEIKFQIQKCSLKSVNAVITDSKSSKQDITKYLDYPPEKIHVIYLAPGSHFKKLPTLNSALSTQRKYCLPHCFVLYVGDVNYNKNVLGLAKACKLIGIPLVIVGKQAVQKDFDKTHVENQPLVQLIKEFGNDKKVMRLGFIPDEDLVAIYNLASVYCQPSFYEGFGLPVLQAMACGTPVVSSNKPCLPEICGEAAIFFDPYQPKEISKAIVNVLSDESLCDKLKQLGFKQAKKFSWEKTGRETYEVYKKVVSGQ